MREVTKLELSNIQCAAEDMGHYCAVQLVLGLPSFPIEDLKRKALNRFQQDAACRFDGFFIERCWVSAFGDLMGVGFSFPHIDPYIHPPKVEFPPRDPEA